MWQGPVDHNPFDSDVISFIIDDQEIIRSVTVEPSHEQPISSSEWFDYQHQLEEVFVGTPMQDYWDTAYVWLKGLTGQPVVQAFFVKCFYRFYNHYFSSDVALTSTAHSLVCPCLGLTESMISNEALVDCKAQVRSELKVGSGCGSCLKEMDELWIKFQQSDLAFHDPKDSKLFCKCHKVTEQTIRVFTQLRSQQRLMSRGLATVAGTQCQLCHPSLEYIKKQILDGMPPTEQFCQIDKLKQWICEYDESLQLRHTRGLLIFLNHVDCDLQALTEFLYKKSQIIFAFYPERMFTWS